MTHPPKPQRVNASWRILSVGCVLAALAGHGAQAATLQAGSPESVWMTHLEEDLLSFWAEPIAAYAAAGSPESLGFQTTLCNDGSMDLTSCGKWQGSAVPVLVAQSRQVYSYTVAFQMTGNLDYLEMARAGVQYQYDSLLDDASGLYKRQATDAAYRANAQEQAYGLLGMSYFANVAGDQTLLSEGVSLHDHITQVAQSVQDRFRLETGGYSQTGAALTDLRLVDQLDQLNAYMTYLAATESETDLRAGYLAEARRIADYILENYAYDEESPNYGLLKQSSEADETSATDYGHSMKAFWFIDQIAILQGDSALSADMQARARALFGEASTADGGWVSKVDGNRQALDQANWWDYAEFDQYLASIVAQSDDPELAARLEAAQQYWFAHFVDPQGGTYGSLSLATGEPLANDRKQYEWKAGFHSFEHALVSYLGEAAASGEAITLYFAIGADPSVLGYGFDYASFAAQEVNGVQAVTYSGLSYGIPAVPLPAGGLLLASALALMAARHRRKRPEVRPS